MGSMVSLISRHQAKGVLLGCLFYVGALGVQRAENLTSKVASIRQSWVQETDYPRPYHVFMPEKAQSKPLELILFLSLFLLAFLVICPKFGEGACVILLSPPAVAKVFFFGLEGSAIKPAMSSASSSRMKFK